MPKDLSFPVDSINNFRFYFKNHETVPYQMFLRKDINGQTTTKKIDYWILDKYYDFDSEHFNQPGNYELKIQPVKYRELDDSQLLRFKFEVLPPPLETKSFSLLQIVIFGVSLLVLFSILFISYYFFNKRKLSVAKQQKEFAGLKLKVIQSQLNPHFMFNALSSIQNLMNKNDVEGANHYLGKFSNLTRRVLDTGDHELISLEDEIKILDEYLQMEQLRFGFNYKIIIDEQINIANIEIPAMLLQPFVENAVKHGVSSLKQTGNIQINIFQENTNIEFKLSDNGGGFNTKSITGNSLGIKLVTERIDLLNQVYGEQLVLLEIKSDESGTTIFLKLKNWV